VATAAADVTSAAALGRAVEEIAAEFGGLDHLVANAGGTVGQSAPPPAGRAPALHAGG
jgi:NAD(P)-dependent dehydrogenase (short-subunit alcohol dehydrogenase family)